MQHPFSGLVGDYVTVVTIPRSDIEVANIDATLESLNKLVESKEALEASNGSISLLVSGYDKDSRELHMIPELRQYFELVDLTPLSEPNGPVNVKFSNDDLRAFLERHFQTMDSAYGKFRFSGKKTPGLRNW